MVNLLSFLIVQHISTLLGNLKPTYSTIDRCRIKIQFKRFLKSQLCFLVVVCHENSNMFFRMFEKPIQKCMGRSEKIRRNVWAGLNYASQQSTLNHSQVFVSICKNRWKHNAAHSGISKYAADQQKQRAKKWQQIKKHDAFITKIPYKNVNSKTTNSYKFRNQNNEEEQM